MRTLTRILTKRMRVFLAVAFSTMFFATFFVFPKTADAACSDTSAGMNCNGCAGAQVIYTYPTVRQIPAECIRGRYVPWSTCTAMNFSSICGVACTNPLTCQNCECRCRGANLYCADITTGLSQYCNVSTRDSRCTPTATITSPSNGAVFGEGAFIPFVGTGSDNPNDGISGYRWVVRTTAGALVATSNSRTFSRNNLPVGNYIAWFLVIDGTNATSDWVWVRFSVVLPSVSIIDIPTTDIGVTEGDNITFSGHSTTIDPKGIVWNWWGLRAAGCLPRNTADPTKFYENGPFFDPLGNMLYDPVTQTIPNPAAGTYYNARERGNYGASGPFIRTTGAIPLALGVNRVYYEAAVIGNGSGDVSVCDSRNITVYARPTIDIQANGQDNLLIIKAEAGAINENVSLTWAGAGGSTLCTASAAWSGNKPISGSENVIATNSNQVYTIRCRNAADTPAWDADTARVTVQCFNDTAGPCSRLCGGGERPINSLRLTISGAGGPGGPPPTAACESYISRYEDCNTQPCSKDWKEVVR